MGKLTIKQKKFADEYIISGNATEAYKLAGYAWASDNTAAVEASKLLRNPKVAAYIAERLKDIESKKIADQTEVLQYLTSIMRGECTEETLRGVGEGEQTISDIDVCAKDRIKAAELIGKRYGMWTDRLDVAADVGVTIVDDVDDSG